MRRLIAIFTVLILLVSYFAFVSPSYARADGGQVCYVFDVFLINNTGAPQTATAFFSDIDTRAPLSGTKSLTLNPGESGTLHNAAFIPAGIMPLDDGDPGLLEFTITFFGQAPDAACGGFGSIGDGRINDGPDQEGAPLAAYCASGGIAVWDIDAEGHGTLGFTATKDQITKALAQAASSGKNVLVGQGLGNSLYALSSNQLTLVGPDVKESGKTYEFIAPATVCSS